MNKNISLALNIVLFVAVAVLYGMEFSSSEEGQLASTERVEEIADSVATAQNKELSQVVAFINTDSIFRKYELAIDMRNELESEEKRLARQLRNEEAAFQQEYQRLQQKAPTMSQFEGRMAEQDLLEKQQKLVKLEENLSRKLVTLEQAKNEELNLKIRAFLEKYTENKPYEVVLSYNEMGIIRWGDQRLDITSEVIEKMNEAYQKEKI